MAKAINPEKTYGLLSTGQVHLQMQNPLLFLLWTPMCRLISRMQAKRARFWPLKQNGRDFYHYAVINIPAGTTRFPGGAADVKPALGLQLANDMGTNHYIPNLEQFGGPCPPWNDERLHHYHFIVLAFDTPADMKPAESAKAAYAELSASAHLIAKGEVVGTYSLNPKIK